MDDRDLRCDIVEVGRRLYARGLIGGNEGNVSVRKGDTLFVTPAGVCKGFLTPEMIVRTDLEGRPQGGGRASSEILMHTAVYRRRADVRAVVHAHPPTATGFAAAGIPLDRPLIAEAVVTLGAVPIIPYGQPSTTELAQSVGDAICTAHALLMANHGATFDVCIDLSLLVAPSGISGVLRVKTADVQLGFRHDIGSGSIENITKESIRWEANTNSLYELARQFPLSPAQVHPFGPVPFRVRRQLPQEQWPSLKLDHGLRTREARGFDPLPMSTFLCRRTTLEWRGVIRRSLDCVSAATHGGKIVWISWRA